MMQAASTRTRLTIGDILHILELRTKIVSVSSFLIGTAYALAVSGYLSPLRCVLMLVATVCIDLGTAGFNSYYDYKHGVDQPDTDWERYKVLVQSDLDPRLAFRLACAMFALAAIPGLALGIAVGWEVVAVGVASMAVSYLYSGGPSPLSRTAVGEMFAGGMLGSVLVALSTYVQLETLPLGALLVGLPSTFIIAAILAVNNACDVHGDARGGRRTLAIVVGPEWARRYVYALVAAAYIAAFTLIAVGVIAESSWLPLSAGALVAVLEFARMRVSGFSHQTKATAMAGISRAFLAYTLSMLLALALSKGG